MGGWREGRLRGWRTQTYGYRAACSSRAVRAEVKSRICDNRIVQLPEPLDTVHVTS